MYSVSLHYNYILPFIGLIVSATAQQNLRNHLMQSSLLLRDVVYKWDQDSLSDVCLHNFGRDCGSWNKNCSYLVPLFQNESSYKTLVWLTNRRQFLCVFPIIDHEFRHNIVKLAVDYFDNVLTKFIVYNRADAWKTDVHLFFTINKLSNWPHSLVAASNEL